MADAEEPIGMGDIPEESFNAETFSKGFPHSPEKLLALLNGLKDLSDEDREEIRQQLLARRQQHMAAVDEPFFTSQLFILFSFLLVLLPIVFFGYKLYKSLKEKERKRDEKKKLRQQKKKK